MDMFKYRGAAIDRLLVIEGNGKVTNDPDDPGGLTKWGIAKRYNPTLDIANLTRDDAIRFYEKNWWTARSPYEQIRSQKVATKLFILAVNVGIDDAGKCLQIAVRAVSGKQLIIDGMVGTATTSMANICDEELLYMALVTAAATRYAYKSKAKYTNGLLNRAFGKDI